MVSNEIVFMVSEITDEIHSFNGFDYRRIIIVVPENYKVSGYIKEESVPKLKKGKYFSSRKAYVTFINKLNYKDDICFRIDSFYIIRKKRYMQVTETSVTFEGILLKSKNGLRHQGVMGVPVYNTYIIFWNEHNKRGASYVFSFYKMAEKLANLDKDYFASITGILTVRSLNKPCFFIVKDIELKKEVNSK